MKVQNGTEAGINGNKNIIKIYIYRLRKNIKNFDLFEILTSDREGRSDYYEEDKYHDPIPEFEGEGEGDFSIQQKSGRLQKRSTQQHELESSEDYYSDGEPKESNYNKHLRERVKKYI